MLRSKKQEYLNLIKENENLKRELLDSKKELSKEKLYSESIFETISDSLILTENDGTIINANNTFRDLINHAQTKNKKIDDFIVDKNNKPLTIKDLRKPTEITCYLLKEGDKRELISSWRQVLNPQNKIINIFMFKDITEFNKQLKSYANFAQLNPSPVFRLDTMGNVLTSNLVSMELFEMFDDFNWFDISFDLNEEMAQKLIQHSRIHIEELKYKDKYFYVQYRGIKNNNYINVYAFDVTEQKINEKKIKELQDELIDEAYNQGIAENSVHVLHNIGNVLTSLIGKGDELKKSLAKRATTHLFTKVMNKLNSLNYNDLDEKVYLNLRKSLNTILEAFLKEEKTLIETNNFTMNESIRISEIISTQQKYANLKTKMNSLLKVEDLVNDIVTMHKYRIEKRNINLSLKICPRAEVFVEKVGLSQTISNAIVNAIESIDQRAKAQTKDQDRKIDIISETLDNKIVLKISDNGIGIEKENLDKLFNYGFSTKERGSGFGLHNCANYMKTIEGSIEIKSEGHNKGAQTVITIPLKQAT